MKPHLTARSKSEDRNRCMRGKISNATVGSLKNFFNLPEEVFAGKAEFTDEHRAAIAAKIKEEFGNVPKAKRGPKPKKSALISVGKNMKPEKVKKKKSLKLKRLNPKAANSKPLRIRRPLRS